MRCRCSDSTSLDAMSCTKCMTELFQLWDLVREVSREPDGMLKTVELHNIVGGRIVVVVGAVRTVRR